MVTIGSIQLNRVRENTTQPIKLGCVDQVFRDVGCF